MAIRIKSHWHNLAAKPSMKDIAGAVAFIAWRIAQDKAMHLHGNRFIYENDRQRMAVIAEYLYFQVQMVDRLIHVALEEAERRTLIIQLALKLAEHVQDNSLDLFGPGDYGRPFIDGLNGRNNEYAELNFTDSGPSYPFLRHLGYQIQRLMGEREENRWVIDQIMDRDGGEIYQQLSRAVHDLLS
jgi:hypothetical protein